MRLNRSALSGIPQAHAAFTGGKEEEEKTTTLTPLPTDRRPIFNDLVILRAQAAAKLKPIHTHAGGGQHGLMHIICRQGTNDYALLTNNAPAFVVPNDPGAHPAIPNGTTQVQAMSIREMHKYELEARRTYIAAQGAIAEEIIAACAPGSYLNPLKHPITGFAHVTPERMFTYLFATYGKITDTVLEENAARMDEAWDPNTQQIELLFERMNEIQAIAANHDPITTATIMHKTKQIIAATGKFEVPLSSWDTRLPAHQTWADFRNHFTTAYLAYLNTDEYRQNQTVHQAGYHAKTATDTNPFSFGAYCWSHGWGFDPQHTSCNCKRKAPGHQDQATLENMMGGCNRLRRRKDEVPVYVNPNRGRGNRGNNNDNGNSGSTGNNE